jgi:hypothetical protein
MARHSFEFRTSGVVQVSFDPEEFRGLDPLDIVEAIRAELPPNVEQLDLMEAAEALHNALEFEQEFQRD